MTPEQPIKTLYLCSPAFPRPETMTRHKHAAQSLTEAGFRVVFTAPEEPSEQTGSTFAAIIIARLSQIRQLATLDCDQGALGLAVISGETIRSTAIQLETEQARAFGLPVKRVDDWIDAYDSPKTTDELLDEQTRNHQLEVADMLRTKNDGYALSKTLCGCGSKPSRPHHHDTGSNPNK
ncbi:MAG: hypothetical protein ACYTEQ_28675 [Planctomycetota bacterium]|jgi:hypothetical protein